MVIVVTKWLRAAPKPKFHDKEVVAVLTEVASIERSTAAMEASEVLDRGRLRADRDRLAALRSQLLERYADLNLKDPHLFDRTVAAVAAAHARVSELVRRA